MKSAYLGGLWQVGKIVEFFEPCSFSNNILSCTSPERDDGYNINFGIEGKSNFHSLIRPLKTEAERRGAKFGTMGVIKPTGEKCIFIKENGYMWRVCEESGDACNYVPKNIRLDHEPEYKEIPFSEATDEQRMEVGNLVYEDGECKVVEIHKFSNGSYAFTIENNGAIIRGVHRLTVRVPA